MHPRTRLPVVAALTAAVLALAAPAFAHVTAVADTTASGAHAKVTLRVPHGCDGASTTAVRVQIPEGVGSVRPQVNPSWELEVAGDGETVTEVAWVGGDLPDAHLDEFGLGVQLPGDAEGETLHFPVIQECGDAERAWIEIPASPGAEEPKHPAPAITLTAGEGDAHGGDAAETTAETTAGATREAQVTALTSATPDAEPTAASSRGTSTLGVLALVAGLLGLVVGTAALIAARRR